MDAIKEFYNIDIKENYIRDLDAALLAILIKDKSSGKNIIWATDTYKHRGIGYLPQDYITVEAITGIGGNIIKPRTEKSKKEQQQILAALHSLKETGAQEETAILVKLGDFFMEKPESWVAIDFSDWSGRRKELFNQIRDAILNRYVIQFDYYGQYGDMAHRCVEPIQLLFKEYTWYVRAYCRTKQDMRLFKVMRMKRVEVLEETFPLKNIEALRQQPEDISMMENPAPSTAHCTEIPSVYGPAPEITLWIDKKEAYRIYDRFEEEEITVLPDGNFTVCLNCYVDDWIYGMVLSFGPSAQILAPEWMRSEMRRRIDAMRKLY